MNSKKEKSFSLIAAVFVVVTVVLVLSIMVIVFLNGGKSNDVEVSGGSKNVGLKCTDSEILHPALRDYTPISHTNTIMANFDEEGLSTITLYYVGTYSSPTEAKQAEAYAQADYGLILAKEYGVSTESFSHSFTIDSEKVNMTITAKNGSINDKTAPYFLLEQNRVFPKTLDGLKQRYEERNFSCEVVD